MDEGSEAVGVAGGDSEESKRGGRSSDRQQDETKLGGLEGIVRDVSISATSEYNYSTDDFEEEEEGKNTGPSSGVTQVVSQGQFLRLLITYECIGLLVCCNRRGRRETTQRL